MRVLIVDDDESMRKLLALRLSKWGYDVIEASSGSGALDILNNDPSIDMVISDWMMPGMDGPTLCQRIRSLSYPHYLYIILLTARDAKEDLIKGLEAGADDFIVKPFHKEELKVRLYAGERIVMLERSLAEKNKKLEDAINRLEKDLEAAAKIQQSLLPEKTGIYQGFQFDWVFRPSSYVAGDIFNFFELDETHVGFYILDVAGHGVPAALLSVTLSRLLTPIAHIGTPLKRFIPDPPHYEIVPPHEAVQELNERFQDENVTQYFTMIYGIIDSTRGLLELVQAGHPNPIFIRGDGTVELCGEGGFPVGMLPDIQYESKKFQLNQGDRIILYSDGVTECTDPSGEMFGETRLLALIERYKHLKPDRLLQQIIEEITTWRRHDTFDDDVTLISVTYRKNQ